MHDGAEGVTQGEPASWRPCRSGINHCLPFGAQTGVRNSVFSMSWMVLGQVTPFNKAPESFCLKPEHPFVNLSRESYLSTHQTVVLGCLDWHTLFPLLLG